jgi:hypothetical protein
LTPSQYKQQGDFKLNRKWTAAALGILGAVGMVGSGTFAAWSDFGYSRGHNVGADVLELDLSGRGMIAPINDLKLDPDDETVNTFIVAAREGESVNRADLFISMEDLVDTENGCDGNPAEVAGEQNEASIDDCEIAGTGAPATGDFSSQARYSVRVRETEMGPNGPVCKFVGTSPWGYIDQDPARPGIQHPVNEQRLNTIPGLRKVKLAELNTDGSAVCVEVVTGLYAYNSTVEATNQIQGDSASFNLRFDLEQVLL